MLELKNISKIYKTAELEQKALDKVSINFRESEFVSILGPSGSGKTTLLNIVGGLDNYTTGDLIINGVTTKNYKDRDWDTYRNHKIGFVFQSYNLIPHQNILANVELALTLSGVNKKERRKRAIQALEKVGLKAHIHKKPNQLSGGQMQRVAIARALVNNPDILLADEPTGALDSKTSSQIMELLASVAKDRLVIMVTHNDELANNYSTRIIELRDGQIKGDTNPYKPQKEKLAINNKDKKTSMSFLTALSLSLNNLMTKKGRTILTAFAGSIGIIGIALILSLSNGVQNYISSVEEETLASYPLTIESNYIDFTSIMNENMERQGKNIDKGVKENKIYSNNTIDDTLSIMSNSAKANNLKQFKKYIEDNKSLKKQTTAISYDYNLDLQLYKNTTDEVIQVNPDTVLQNLGMSKELTESMMMGSVWNKLFENDDLNNKLYQVVSGRMPKNYDEVVLLVDKNNQISDYILYALGIKDQKELKALYNDVANGKKVTTKVTSYDYDELIGLSYKLLLNTDYYEKSNGIWINNKNNEQYMKNKLKNAPTIKIVGIIRPNENATVASNSLGGVFYTKELEDYVIDKINNAKIVEEQKQNTQINVLTGLKFNQEQFDFNSLTNEQKAYLQSLPADELAEIINNYNDQASATYESTLDLLGAVDKNTPKTINIYAKDFEAKETIKNIIEDYNTEQKENDKEQNVINYNDLVGMLMSSVTKIVDMISYVLIGFVSISLIVSSIMIGIITYISVLERTKEIGILRAIGASKKDISRVFNAETLIVGLIAGVLGIVVTIILNIPINILIKNVANVNNISKLPPVGAIILIIISVVLTMIAGLIPARMASKKDPVESLRSE